MVEPSSPNSTSCGKTALRKKLGLQQGKDSMVLKLRKVKSSSVMPRKAMEKEGSFTNLSIKLGDQVLLQIIRKRRMTYHTYNAIGVRNMVIMKASVIVQVRGILKSQLLILMKTILIERKEIMIAWSSSSKRII